MSGALAREDALGARRAVRALEVDHDEALAILAAHAAEGSALAVELLIVQLDESGVVRRFARAALLDESAIDDVSQDSLISIAASVGSFSGGRRSRPGSTASCAAASSITCAGNGPQVRCPRVMPVLGSG